MARKREQLTREDLIAVVENGVKQFVRYDEGRVLYSMGRNGFIELARNAEARYQVRGVMLCDTEEINNFILENCKLD